MRIFALKEPQALPAAAALCPFAVRLNQWTLFSYQMWRIFARV
jgi:hypothetical protein